MGEPVKQLLDAALEEGVNAGPVSPLKTMVSPTIQEPELDLEETLEIQGVVHSDEFF